VAHGPTFILGLIQRSKTAVFLFNRQLAHNHRQRQGETQAHHTIMRLVHTGFRLPASSCAPCLG